MLSTPSFFDVSDFTFKAIFSADKPVWSALHNLKPFMKTFTYPDYSTIFPKNGEPLPKTIVLHNNEIYNGDEVDIEFGDAPKGQLLVVKKWPDPGGCFSHYGRLCFHGPANFHWQRRPY